MPKVLNELIIIVTSMLCITALVIFALSKGLDGLILSGGMAILGGLAGYKANDVKNKIP